MRAGLVALLVLCSVVSGVWLALGAVVGATQYWPQVAGVVEAAAASGNTWAAAVLAAAPASEPIGQAVLDYGFSVLNLLIAVVLLAARTRTWAVRLLALALVGSAGAFNLQAHAAARAVEVGTGLALGGVHQVLLHAIACAAYILALLVFPTPTWDGLPGGRPARRGLAITGIVTFLLVGLGTALLPHTTSCVLFFGFLVPVVGLVVLPRRVRRGPGAEQRTQARLLFSTLLGVSAVAVVLGIVTVILSVLGNGPGLALVDPTAHGTGSSSGEPLALLFWFSRLVSAAVAVVVLVATRRRLWTAERWFSRGLAVLLVMAVCGGGFVVLRTIGTTLIGPVGAVVVATVAVSLTLGQLYVQAERLVDRLLYGSRPTPYSVLADIMSLSHSTTSRSPDLARVAEAVALGLGASTCRLTVRRPGLRDRTYEWTDRSGGVGAADLLEVPIHHGNEQVGALTVDRQSVSGLNALRDSLVTDIADGLGVVLEASRSGIELERQLRAALAHAEEIAVSRRRAVEEMDSERRRIERDLHDGAQHHLVSLRLTLGLVEHQVAGGDLGQAREWLHKLTGQLTAAEAVLAATADGVSSLVLSEKGLVAALDADLGAAHPPVGFDADGVAAGRRFPARIEAAVWFCCAESVGNARKHAPGAPVTVRLAEQAGVLTFTVQDEGPGFALDRNGEGAGRGLRNMTGRVSAVGGTVMISSTPGAGTTVVGTVPVPHEPDAASTPAPDHTTPAVVEPAPQTPSPDTSAERPHTLIGQVTELLRLACAVYRGTATHGRVDDLAHRLVEPLRIAVVASTDTGRRMLVEALIGAPDVPRRPFADPALPVWFTYGTGGVEDRPDAVTVSLPAPALRAMTLVEAPTLDDDALDPVASDRCRTLLGTSGDDAAAVDALVLLLHYGRGADARMLEVLHAAGHRHAVGVLARADESDAVAERAAGEYDNDDAVRRVCQAVVSVRPETAVAAARLGIEEHRLLNLWAATTGLDESGSGTDDVPDDVAAAVEELGPSGAHEALDLVRRGEGCSRSDLAAALVRRSGLADLQELIASRFARRADVLRCRSVLAGLDAVLRVAPPADDGAQRLHYQLERVRAGAHELREIELLDALRSGELFLPDEERRAAELLLGAEGEDVRIRLGLGPDAPLAQMQAEAAGQPTRWRNLAAHPMTSTNLRSAAQVLVRTCEQLAVEVDETAGASDRQLHGSDV